MRDCKGGDDLDHRPQSARPQHDRDQKGDMVIAEKDVLDSGLDIAGDDLLQARRLRSGQRRLGTVRVEQVLRGVGKPPA